MLIKRGDGFVSSMVGTGIDFDRSNFWLTVCCWMISIRTKYRKRTAINKEKVIRADNNGDLFAYKSVLVRQKTF